MKNITSIQTINEKKKKNTNLSLAPDKAANLKANELSSEVALSFI
jgi:hypothetical protein